VRIEFEGALVLEFLEDVFLDLGDRALRVDEVVVEVVLEGKEGLPGLLLEHPVTADGERLVEVGGAFLLQFAAPGGADLGVVLADEAAALELAGDALVFIDEKDDDVEGRLAEMDVEREGR
jgi:hypothetical protein